MGRNPTAVARKLRKSSTDVERLLWSRVRNRRLSGYRFKHQHPIHDFVVDFLCTEARLIVELDGGQHAQSKEVELRDLLLAGDGYRVLRFWNNEVLENIDGVLETILENLTSPSP